MKMIINGKSTDSSNNTSIEVFNPATSMPIDSVPAAAKEDLEFALDTAKKGVKIWSSYSFEKRYEILCNAADRLLEAKELLAETLCKENGKPYSDALNEVIGATKVFRGYAEKMRHLYKEVIPDEDSLILLSYDPLGVVACIVPFNFPVDLYSHKVAPALAMGNAVIVKPATVTPLANILMTQIILDAGVPTEALQIVTGRGSDIGEYLSASPKVNAISLTGSTEAGISVYENAAKHMARVSLELGGNDAMIILKDSDIDHAVDCSINSRTMNSGQVCACMKRFVVHNSVKEEFTKRLVSKLKELRMGDPFDADVVMGPLVSRKASEQVQEQVEHAVSQGASCILGGKCLDHAFFPVTVLTNVSRESDIANDMEIFGPVFPIIGFDTEEEAIEIANQTTYGLTGCVITNDYQHGYKIANQLDVGTASVNGSSIRPPSLPWTAHKMSGIGSEGFATTLLEMVDKKNIVLNGFFK